MPVPDLKCTLDTYLTIMKSVLSPEEYSRTQIIVEDFGKLGGTGEMLQEKLKKVSEVKDNWVIVIHCCCFLFIFYYSSDSSLHKQYL